MDDDRHDEPLIEGLRELPAAAFDVPVPDSPLRARVLDRTLRIVRARRRSRMLVLILSAFALWAIGLFMGMNSVNFGGRPQDSAHSVLDGHADPRSIIERVALASPPDRPRLLREAGDAFAGRGKLEKALDCYRQLIELEPSIRTSPPEPGDTWLLAALKVPESRR